MPEWKARNVGGPVHPSSLPTITNPVGLGSVRGLFLRGLVVRTGGFGADSGARPPVSPNAVYCDAIVYSSSRGSHRGLLRNILVLQPGSSPDGGTPWRPKATTRTLGGNQSVPFDVNVPTILGTADGEHILISFIDDNFQMPVALGTLPHPYVDVANETETDAAHRTMPQPNDPAVKVVRHKGTSICVRENGDVDCDTRRSYTDVQPDGAQPPPAYAGTTGNVRIKLPAGSQISIEIIDGSNVTQASLQLTQTALTLSITGVPVFSAGIGGDGRGKLDVSTATQSAAIAEPLAAAWGALIDALQLATNGASGTPVFNPASLPSWPTTAKSEHLKVPAEPATP